MTLIRAIAFAAQEHAGQTRMNGTEPYILHPIRVAEHTDLAGYGKHIQIAAVLHDVIEDCRSPEKNSAFIKHTWPESWVYVDLLTKDPKKHKETYYAAIKRDVTAINLKLLDRADNLETMFQMLKRTDRPDTDKGTLRWAQAYIAKTRTEIEPLSVLSDNHYVIEVYRRAFNRLSNILIAAEVAAV